MRYCLDTNVFIEGWTKYWSIDTCPDYWEILDTLAGRDIIFSPIEVKREIEKIHDGLYKWISDKPHMFKDITDDVQKCLRYIMSKYPRLVDSIKQRSMADPWVIAYAKAMNATVVTKENLTKQSSKRIKIPDVCNALNIPWMDDFEFANRVGIRFTARLNTL